MIENIRKNSVTILTEQGIGDVFWNYQKIAPFYKELNFLLGIGERVPAQCRAAGMIGLLPKVKSVEYRIIFPDHYMEIATMKKGLKSFLDQGLDYYEYSMTSYIREGIRIDDIDPGLPMEWDIPLPTEKVDLPFKNYMGLSASGPGTFNNLNLWRPKQYIEVLNLIKRAYGMPDDFPVILLGASYDEKVIKEWESILDVDKVPHQRFIDYPWKQVFYLLQNCTFFFAYGCGLNCLADNMDVPQLMVIFDHLPGALFAFAKRRNIESGIYNATMFGRTQEQIIEEDIKVKELPGGFKRIK